MQNSFYSIQSGQKTKMYTLWHHYQEYVHPVGYKWKEGYVCNLSTDLETAITKAKERIGDAELKVNEIELNAITRRASSEIDHSIIQNWGGKFAKASIYELSTEDLIYYANQCRNNQSVKKTIELIGQELEERGETIYLPAFRSHKMVKSMIKTVEREMRKRQQQAQREADKANSNHVGAIGEKLEKTMTVVMTRSGEGFYGSWYLCKMRDESGNSIVYMGSKYIGAERGDEVTMSFKVKAHEEYEGEKQTKISHPKVIEVKTAENA